MPKISFEHRLSSLFHSSLGGVLALCIVVFGCYFNSLRNGFVADDHYIIELQQDNLSLQALVKTFTESDTLRNAAAPYYRPLNRASYLVDKRFFGLNPVGYHSVNLLLHILCSVLLYFVFLRFGIGRAAALLTAILFGIHPVNTEAVDFISGRNNIMATACVLASVLLFLIAQKRTSRTLYLLSAIAFFLGCLAKETALMLLPFFIFLKLFRDKSDKGSRTHHFEINPGYILSAVIFFLGCLSREIVLMSLSLLLFWKTYRDHRQDSGPVFTRDVNFIAYHILALAAYFFLRMFAVDSSYLSGHMSGLAGRMREMIYIIPAYFLLLVAPFHLSFSHQVPSQYQALIYPLLIGWALIITAVVILVRRKKPLAIIGLIWFLLNLLPVSNILPIPSASMAERYLYMPMIGIFLIVAHGIDSQFKSTAPRKMIIGTVAVAFAAIFGATTVSRNTVWHDNLSLTRSIAIAEPLYAYGHFDYGYESYLRGDQDTARQEFQKALTIDPQFPRSSFALYYLGTMVLNTDPGRAEQYFRDAVNADATNSAARFALAVLLLHNDTGAAAHEFGELKKTMILLSSIYRMTEVDDILFQMKARGSRFFKNQSGPLPGDGRSVKPWDCFYRFTSGSQVCYAGPTRSGDVVSVETKQVLSKLDRRALGLSLIRYPLGRLAQASFFFNVNCRQQLYQPASFAFLDPNGKILAADYPEREEEVFYEHVQPNTLMALLLERICRTTSRVE